MRKLVSAVLTDRSVRIGLWICVALMMLLYLWLSGARQASGPSLLTIDPSEGFGQAPRFTLTDQHGSPFSSEVMEGKVWAVSFIFTRCEDECPIITGRLKAAADLLEAEGVWDSDVQFVSITVDPEYDTPEQLRNYAERYGISAGWHFLTGEPHYVRSVVTSGFHDVALKIERSERSPRLPGPAVASAHGPDHDHGSYDVVHSERIVIIDRAGTIRARIHALESLPHEIAHAIRQYL